jgi:TatD DNase family protein
MYIDTHAHLTMPEYSDLNEVLLRAKDAKVEAIINASFDLGSSRASVCLSGDSDLVFAAVGIHPHHAEEVTAAALSELKHLLSDPRVVGVGETGLDYFKMQNTRESQINAFRAALRLAQEVDKPVIIHCRDAMPTGFVPKGLSPRGRQAQEDVIKIMKEENKGKLKGVFHCFAGDDELIEFAKEIGFYISFTGNLTFKKTQRVCENVSKVPLSMLLLETDCPYLAPEPFRGKRNEPAYVYYIAKAIAEIKGVAIEEVAKATTQNAKDLFKI